MTGPLLPALPNCKLVGSGVDILKVDPLHLAGAGDNVDDAPVFVQLFDLSLFEDLTDQQFSKPVAFVYQPAFGGKDASTYIEASTEADCREFVEQTGSLEVSDPTGKLFAASCSSTFTDMRKTTQTMSTVLSYVSYRVDQHWLTLDQDSDDLALSESLQDAVARLPQEDTAASAKVYDQFVQTYGTHVMTKALFGGRAVQRTSLSTKDYLACTESGVNVQVQAQATFELVATKDNVGVKDTRDTRYKNASSLKVEQIDFIGGKTTQQFLDMWKQSVPEEPMPTEAAFPRLSSIFDNVTLFGPTADPDVLAACKKNLDAAIDRHLQSNGTNVLSDQLGLGNTVTLSLMGSGPARLLSGDGAFAHTAVSTAGPDPTQRWVLTDPTGKAVKGSPLHTGQVVALTNEKSSAALNAKAGSDHDYQVGDGLAGTDPTTSTPAAHWRFTLTTASQRDVIVDGDLVYLGTQWADSSGMPCCLLGEPDPNDSEQRVYGFGRTGKPGTAWRVTTAG